MAACAASAKSASLRLQPVLLALVTRRARLDCVSHLRYVNGRHVVIMVDFPPACTLPAFAVTILISWLDASVRDCSASRPKHNPPCRVALDGLAEKWSNEEVVDQPGASVGNGVEKCGDNCESSKVR